MVHVDDVISLSRAALRRPMLSGTQLSSLYQTNDLIGPLAMQVALLVA